jgi:hypothetical protein
VRRKGKANCVRTRVIEKLTQALKPEKQCIPVSGTFVCEREIEWMKTGGMKLRIWESK